MVPSIIKSKPQSEQSYCLWYWLTQLLLITSLLNSISHTGANSDWIQSCNNCHCHWNSGKKTADCKNKQLSTVPNDLSNELQVIDLSNNMIPELRKEELMEANLQNLHKIFLKNCTIQELNREALKGLTILIELDLSYNLIKILHVGTFRGLIKLRNLVMNNNQIESLKNYLFVDLPFLSRVEFKNNRLKRIEIYAFGQLPVLSAVYLESNDLTVLRRETFQRTPKLVHLSLASNPWNCTCELQEFRDFALANRLYTPPTDCYEPAQLREKLWNEIPSENFACKPNILGSEHSYVNVNSENITLPCRIEGSPRPNVTWLYNKRPINPNDLRFRVLNSVEQHRAGNPNILNSELRILGIRSTDKGSYTCSADNRGGRAEAEFQLVINGEYISAHEGSIDVNRGVVGISTSTSDSDTNFLLIICLIATTLLLLLMVVVLLIFWYCRRVKTYQKNTTILSENGLISSKLDKTHNSMIEGSVIMEMQKSLLTDVNPVEKPPRRSELENIDGIGGGADSGQETKKNLLDETQFGAFYHRDDETHSMTFSDVAVAHTCPKYVDETYATTLPPDLLAFPARVPPSSPSMQSSQSNIPEQIIFGIRSPLMTSPVYAHMTPHGIYGTTTKSSAIPSGFMTLQHPKSRNLGLIATANNRQQQSPFVPAPVVYSSTSPSAVVVKQGYMTIPRKPRVPSWAPSSSATNSTQLSEFQSPTSPNPSDTGTATAAELTSEPVYDNLGLRTTAGGSSTLNLHKIQHQEVPARYTMRDRPLPATPSLTSVNSNHAHQQQHQRQHQPTINMNKIYEPLRDLGNQFHPTANAETQSLYDTTRHHSALPIVSSGNNTIVENNVRMSNAGNSPNKITEPKLTKIPPRPPPKPKKKISVTASCSGHGSTSQLFDDESEDGTEV